MIFLDVFGDHDPEPFPSQDPPMNRSRDLLQYTKYDFVKRGVANLNWTSWTLEICGTWLNWTEQTFQSKLEGRELNWSRSRFRTLN